MSDKQNTIFAIFFCILLFVMGTIFCITLNLQSPQQPKDRPPYSYSRDDFK